MGVGLLSWVWVWACHGSGSRFATAGCFFYFYFLGVEGRLWVAGSGGVRCV